MTRSPLLAGASTRCSGFRLWGAQRRSCSSPWAPALVSGRCSRPRSRTPRRSHGRTWRHGRAAGTPHVPSARPAPAAGCGPAEPDQARGGPGSRGIAAAETCTPRRHSSPWMRWSPSADSLGPGGRPVVAQHHELQIPGGPPTSQEYAEQATEPDDGEECSCRPSRCTKTVTANPPAPVDSCSSTGDDASCLLPACFLPGRPSRQVLSYHRRSVRCAWRKEDSPCQIAAARAGTPGSGSDRASDPPHGPSPLSRRPQPHHRRRAWNAAADDAFARTATPS
jgi:hypothetical protein